MQVNVGFCGFLALIFITLKLTHVIAWAWWWVLAPLWIPLVLLGAILIMAGTIELAYKLLK